jgi:predicted CXXCH cytochrome family protein
LFQAPLSFYAKAGQWGLSPGYENGDYAFNRIIQPGCIYCHSGRPQPVAHFAGKYDSTAFTQTSVGCENCHGPGSAHVQAMGDGAEYPKGQDPTIVNPAHLSEQLSDDICMGCHQTGDARVLQPGKTYQDFRPGEPLDKTVSIFQIPPSRENPPQDDHVEHYYSMSLSKCFRSSVAKRAAQQMRCITCHDPHVEPTGAEIPAFYNGRCMSCHTAASCTGPKAARQQTAPEDNCIGCHMPKRDVVVISHSSITNHRILARPDEAFPEEAFTQTTAAMPDLIHVNSIGARDSKAFTPSALTRLQAYALLEPGKPQFHASWLKALAELETSLPDDAAGNALVQAALGHRELEAHNFAAAIDHLRQSLKFDPIHSMVYVDLSEAEDQSGHIEEAIADAKKAVELDPFVAGMQKTLVFRLINGKHYEEAEAAMEKYLQNFPEDDFMRKMLAMAKQ